MQGADFTKLATDFPNEAHIIKYYDWQFAELMHNIKEMAAYARALYEEYDHDRRAVATDIKGSPYAWAGFEAIDSDSTPEELMKKLSAAKIEKLIREYKSGDTKRNASKTQNEMPQKHKTKYLKNTKRNTSKTQNEIPQKHKTKASNSCESQLRESDQTGSRKSISKVYGKSHPPC